jgi:long-subunit acyl-CoA synthetase (AMP-forming)
MAKNIHMEPHGFASKDLLTTTMKVQRHEAKKVYKKEIEAMYKEGMLDKKGE